MSLLFSKTLKDSYIKMKEIFSDVDSYSIIKRSDKKNDSRSTCITYEKGSEFIDEFTHNIPRAY